MPDFEDDESPLEWDEVVDVVCVGTSPGVLAYAICCAANDLDVLMVQPSAEPDDVGAQWYSAMTADLDPTPNAASEPPAFSLTRVTDPPVPTGKRVTLETFSGEDLRQWSEHCLHSPFGVMFTQIPELLVPMRTEGGQSITAAVLGSLGGARLRNWLGDCAREHGLSDVENTMAAVIVEEGRIAGVELDDGYRVGSRAGLAWPVKPPEPGTVEPPSGEALTVAIVGRPAGRFATVDLFRQ